MTYTKGPYLVNGLAKDYLVIEPTDNPARAIALVPRKGENVGELEAVDNAHLFAAAPELLEKLEDLVEQAEFMIGICAQESMDSGDQYAAIENAKAVIAKVRLQS